MVNNTQQVVIQRVMNTNSIVIDNTIKNVEFKQPNNSKLFEDTISD